MSDGKLPKLGGVKIDPPKAPYALLPLLPSPLLSRVAVPDLPAATSPAVPPLVEGADERAQRKLDLATWDANCALTTPEEFVPVATEAEALEKAKKLAARKEEKPLWGCVQRWTNAEAAKKKDAIVVIAGHANGFHKETYEPFFEQLLKKSQVPVAELWAMDTTDAGYAGFLNRGNLGWAVSWSDIGRDMLSLLAHLPAPGVEVSGLLPSPTSLDYATGLPPAGGRKIFAIGHSASAQGWLWASHARPTAISGILILDGVLPNIEMARHLLPSSVVPLSRGAVARKEIFASRDELRSYLKSKPFFQAWDPRSLDLYIRHGFHPLHSNSETTVTLAMSKYREAGTFGNTWLAGFAVSVALTRRYTGRLQTVRMSDSPVPVAKAKIYEAFGAEVVEMQGGHLCLQEQPNVIDHTARLLERWFAPTGPQQKAHL